MAGLLFGEVFFLPPRLLGLFLWLVAYTIIMYRYWRRSHFIWSTGRKYRIALKVTSVEKSAVWRARRWFAIGLLLTLFRAPLITAFLIDLPWLNQGVTRVYEREPLLSPHQWDLCGINDVSSLYVSPSGVYLTLGIQPLAYCPDGLNWGRPTRGWHHLYGNWWYCELTESDDLFWYPISINR